EARGRAREIVGHLVARGERNHEGVEGARARFGRRLEVGAVGVVEADDDRSTSGFAAQKERAGVVLEGVAALPRAKGREEDLGELLAADLACAAGVVRASPEELLEESHGLRAYATGE